MVWDDDRGVPLPQMLLPVDPAPVDSTLSPRTASFLRSPKGVPAAPQLPSPPPGATPAVLVQVCFSAVPADPPVFVSPGQSPALPSGSAPGGGAAGAAGAAAATAAGAGAGPGAASGPKTPVRSPDGHWLPAVSPPTHMPSTHADDSEDEASPDRHRPPTRQRSSSIDTTPKSLESAHRTADHQKLKLLRKAYRELRDAHSAEVALLTKQLESMRLKTGQLEEQLGALKAEHDVADAVHAQSPGYFLTEF